MSYQSNITMPSVPDTGRESNLMPGLAEATERLRVDGASGALVRAFTRSYRQVAAGYSGLLPEEAIDSVKSAISVDSFAECDPAIALSKTAIIRLNGGLGTSMGMRGPKSALVVKDGLTFLDIAVRQVLALRREYHVPLPLAFMNSYNTSGRTLEALSNYPQIRSDVVPLELLQGRIPKLDAQTLRPVLDPDDPLAWCPPGHGELLSLLEATGVYSALHERGYEYLYVANADNLGAIPDPRIAAWMAETATPFVMEVCRRTRGDMKGGHVARRRDDGRLVLRDSNMVPEADAGAFQDISRHRFFNTNCLWLSLASLGEVLKAEEGPGLPVIVNHKTVNPEDASSAHIVQLETGMGTAVSLFPGARLVEVPRPRFIPVKTTNDLLVVRSDFLGLASDSFAMVPRTGTWPIVDLDPKYFRTLSDFDGRFAGNYPSLASCTSLQVIGDASFDPNVECVGNVTINARTPTRLGRMTLTGSIVVG